MMTVITRVSLVAGREPEWDEAFRERIESAREQRGWVSVQLCLPAERLDERVVIGTWETRADWEAWHTDEAFQRTRQRLDGLQAAPGEMTWYEVVHANATSSDGER